jgi:hypothetical protein
MKLVIMYEILIRTSQRTQSATSRNTNRLLLWPSRHVIHMYSEYNLKHTNKLSGKTHSFLTLQLAVRWLTTRHYKIYINAFVSM